MKAVLIISDNARLLRCAYRVASKFSGPIAFACSENTSSDVNLLAEHQPIRQLSLKRDPQSIVDAFGTIISLHCKQVFPASIVNSVRCINFHPGLNPHNRGWYPQVFSIINGLPIGITIHEMDELIDHGPVIYQEEISVTSCDTSFDVYERLLQREEQLFEDMFPQLMRGDYSTTTLKETGNYNSQKDFKRLCALNLDDVDTLGAHINLLRALTFPGYDNAYFRDPFTRKKCYVQVSLKTTD